MASLAASILPLLLRWGQELLFINPSPAGDSLAMNARAWPFVRVESALTEFFEALTSDESSTYGGFDGQNGLFFPLMTNNGPFLV